MGNQTSIFLSYAIEDRKRVEEIYDSLSAEGFVPWMDSRDLKVGEIWETELAENLRNSDFLLVFLSKNSIMKRGALQAELRSVLSLYSERPLGENFLIPVRLDNDSPIPDSLSNVISADLSEKNGWEKLLTALKSKGQSSDTRAIEETKNIIRSLDVLTKDTPHIFVAMPFSLAFSDVYVYGIHRSVEINGFACERADRNSFTGSILGHIKNRISTATAVIADLTGGNPNVYLELGYAWGCKIPAILLIQDTDQLQFDVRDQRCIQYESITALEMELTKELEVLKSSGQI